MFNKAKTVLRPVTAKDKKPIVQEWNARV